MGINWLKHLLIHFDSKEQYKCQGVRVWLHHAAIQPGGPWPHDRFCSNMAPSLAASVSFHPHTLHKILQNHNADLQGWTSMPNRRNLCEGMKYLSFLWIREGMGELWEECISRAIRPARRRLPLYKISLLQKAPQPQGCSDPVTQSSKERISHQIWNISLSSVFSIHIQFH